MDEDTYSILWDALIDAVIREMDWAEANPDKCPECGGTGEAFDGASTFLGYACASCGGDGMSDSAKEYEDG